MSYVSVLLLLCLWFGGCESLTDSSLPEIFYPFGSDQGDSVVNVGSNNCDGPINIPYKIFNYTTLYVSFTCTILRKIASVVSVVFVKRESQAER